MTSPAELWAAAGRCWLAAGAEDEALAAFEAADAHSSLAALYERKGRFGEAGAAYEKTALWMDAARCYRIAGQLEDAERCLGLGEIPLRRAWALAHEHGRTEEALQVLDTAPTRDAGEISGALLVLARVDVARGARDEAARKIWLVLPKLAAISPASGFRIVFGWAVAIAELLRRPDLAAIVLASAPRGFEADVLWDEWSKRTFGAAIPPPISLHRGDDIVDKTKVGSK